MHTHLPTIVRADAPDLQDWTDPRHGKVRFRTLIDGADGPTRALVHGIAEFEAGGFENPHSHDIPETAHVLDGTGQARLGDRRADVAAGDTVFVPAGVVHGWTAADTRLRVLYTFPADRFDEVAYHFEGDG